MPSASAQCTTNIDLHAFFRYNHTDPQLTSTEPNILHTFIIDELLMVSCPPVLYGLSYIIYTCSLRIFSSVLTTDYSRLMCSSGQCRPEWVGQFEKQQIVEGSFGSKTLVSSWQGPMDTQKCEEQKTEKEAKAHSQWWDPLWQIKQSQSVAPSQSSTQCCSHLL